MNRLTILGFIAKSLVGGAIAGLGAAATALADNGVTPLEWVIIASATLAATYGVWQTPNKTLDLDEAEG